jgi:cytochrome c oxidase assembly protein subunit 15
MENVMTMDGRWFDRCLIALMLATLAVNLLSAFIRHQETGLGCAPWPDCYATVGTPVDPATAGPTAVLTPAETAKQAHRGIATALVFLVLFVVYQARQRPLTGFTQHIPILLVAVILILSVIGPASYLKTLPAVATANLIGGMALLTFTWLLWLQSRPSQPGGYPKLRTPARIALAALLLQIFLGAWTSANFAAIACSGFLTCTAETSSATLSSFWYLRELELTSAGRIVLDGAQAMIQQSHHLGALLAAGLLMTLALRCLAAGGVMGKWGLGLIALLMLQIAAGLAGLYTELPLAVVLLHNLTASLLLLTSVRILLLTAEQPA